MPISQKLLKEANDAALLAMLKDWEASGGARSAAPMSANSKVPPAALSPELAAALQQHMQLPEGQTPDELDAAETLLALEGGDFGAAKKPGVKAAKVYEAGEAVEGMKPKEVYESHKKCAPGEFGMNKEGTLAKHIKALAEKQAGPVSEYMSFINPLNLVGGSTLGGLAAALTPTRSLKQQAEFDARDGALRSVANVLVPGMGAYRGFKRIGAGIRSPEMKAIKAQRMADKARRDEESVQNLSDPEGINRKAAGWKTEMLGNLINPLNLYGGSMLGAGAAALTPTRTLNQQSESDDSTWSNIFIPGQASYNWFKRVGAATRSPEMKAMRARAKAEQKLTDDAERAVAVKESGARSFGALVARATTR